MAKTADYYHQKITSEHRFQPKYTETILKVMEPLAEMQISVEHLPQDFDLDLAIGVQLDAIGVRVNRDRLIDVPIWYFGVTPEDYIAQELEPLPGIGNGFLKGQFDPLYGEQPMGDNQYRHVLRAVIEANHWDGTIPHAYECYDTLFSDGINYVVIQDYGNMSMAIALYGGTPNPDEQVKADGFTIEETEALFLRDNLKLKPGGIKQYYLMKVDTLDNFTRLGEAHGGPPAFGVGVDNQQIRGVGTGYLLKVMLVE